jgi:hypothetical protein
MYHERSWTTKPFLSTSASPARLLRLCRRRALAKGEIEEAGGRFAVERPKPQIVGAGPVSYPAQPASSPWASDPVPNEEPLGFDVNAIEPVGTGPEIEASLKPASDESLADAGGEAMAKTEPTVASSSHPEGET